MNKWRSPSLSPPCPGSDDISPDTFCRVFFTDEDITKIARYSEKYRMQKAVSSLVPSLQCKEIRLFLFSLFTHPSQQPRRFKRAKVGISSADVTMFFAITMYMGVVRLPSMEAYWNHGAVLPKHFFAQHMSFYRYPMMWRCLALRHLVKISYLGNCNSGLV